MNYAKTFLGGNLTRNPELRYTSNGVPYCDFAIAVNRKFKKNDLQQEEVDFFECVAWGKTAEAIGSFVNKGQNVFLECEPRQENWVDKTTQTNRSKIKFSVLKFEFTGPKQEADNFGGDNLPPVGEKTHAPVSQGYQNQPNPTSEPDQSQPAPPRFEDSGESEDDIPF